VLGSEGESVIVGVVNVTPDSFSDGGLFYRTDDAIAQGLLQVEYGAHVIDVGGESTRPGAAAVSVDEELRRILPVVEALSNEGVLVSIDTAKPTVAQAAIDAGAAVVNDVSGFRDPAMIEVCAQSTVGVVAMHMLGDPRTMQDNPTYDDVVSEVRRYLEGRIGALIAGGIIQERICIDPGIGFGKAIDHNLTLLNNLDRIAELGSAVMVGTSRKAFLGALTGRDATDRDVATAVSVALAIAGGANVIRVHNVPYAADAVALTDAMVRARGVTGGPSEI
jgi:dihydropteroate synthase